MSAEVLDHYHTYGRREGEEDFPNTLISGISTFLGARVIPPVKDQLVDAGVKAAVLGMPWEGTNTCRPGASYGPRAIRRATEHYLSYHGEFQVDLFDDARACRLRRRGDRPGQRPPDLRSRRALHH